MIKATLPSFEEKQLRQRLTQNSSDIDTRRKLARICFHSGNVQEAAEIYGQILQTHSRDLEALNNLVHFYLERNGYDHAATLLNAMLTINPSSKSAQYQLAALKAFLDQSRTAPIFSKLYEKIASADDCAASLATKKEYIPCLIEMNGDLLWIPGDLIRFLWHTVRKPIRSFIPSFYAETEHYIWIREKIAPGDTILDVGSNIGIFATMMGTRVGPNGQVFAFEPSKQFAADLRRVMAMNELPQVTVLEAAASDRNGETSFFEIQESDVRRESSHLGEIELDRVPPDIRKDLITVKTVVLDDFIQERNLSPKLIKIDVEGAEFLVLEGLKKTMASLKPKLVIEFHADGSGFFDHKKFEKILRAFGYQLQTEDKTYYCS